MSMRYCEPSCKKWQEGKCRKVERVPNGILVYVDMDCILVKSDLSKDWSKYKDCLKNPNERR